MRFRFVIEPEGQVLVGLPRDSFDRQLRQPGQPVEHLAYVGRVGPKPDDVVAALQEFSQVGLHRPGCGLDGLEHQRPPRGGDLCFQDLGGLTADTHVDPKLLPWNELTVESISANPSVLRTPGLLPSSVRSPRHTFSYPILSAYRLIAQTIEPATVETNFIMPDFGRARYEHHGVGDVEAQAAGAHRAAHAGASSVSSEMAGVVDRHRAGARSSAGDFT